MGQRRADPTTATSPWTGSMLQKIAVHKSHKIEMKIPLKVKQYQYLVLGQPVRAKY